MKWELQAFAWVIGHDNNKNCVMVLPTDEPTPIMNVKEGVIFVKKGTKSSVYWSSWFKET